MGKQKGILITFEGNEGCGKTTQIRLLYRYLKKKGFKVFLTREPGGTRAGDAIRDVLLNAKHKNLSGTCETLLYMAARAELVRQVIRPKLEDGWIVLCDRWLDATVAYQGYGEGVGVEWIRSLGDRVTQGIKPRLTFFLDLPLLAGLKRAKSRKKADRMEKKDISFHHRVRKGYLAIAAAEPRRVRRILAQETESIQDIRKKIHQALPTLLRK